eukprot:CAMPEP_0168382212 /NCGR_PEP_ID=MMETSP0228-20121227/13276_1 /TAXON_ID=133427 /ORGANISM="Protoceratium reticulatum, Strain CCCM 535 (=CCMP 1889)" /LENGTH=160 /DNA_ID=CAMNT_0008395335 /DNA_START=29 /DNA_END=513 /DNA_ORIENTATION=+
MAVLGTYRSHVHFTVSVRATSAAPPDTLYTPESLPQLSVAPCGENTIQVPLDVEGVLNVDHLCSLGDVYSISEDRLQISVLLDVDAVQFPPAEETTDSPQLNSLQKNLAKSLKLTATSRKSLSVLSTSMATFRDLVPSKYQQGRSLDDRWRHGSAPRTCM